MVPDDDPSVPADAHVAPGEPPPLPAGPDGWAGAPEPTAQRTEHLSPVDLARQAGASETMVGWVGRVDDLNPTAGSATGFVARVYGRYSRHRGAILAGGLAFFATLSLVPALISLGALGSLLVDPADLVDGIRELLVNQPEFLSTLDPVLDEVSGMEQASIGSIGVRGVISIVVFVYAASRFVYVVRQVLDTAFELKPQPPSLMSRGLAILVTVAIQLAIAVLLVALGFVPRVLDQLQIGVEIGDAIRLLRLPMAALISYLILTSLMRFGVGRRRLVGWANLGSVVGTVVVIGGTLGLSWYLSFSSTYATVIATLGTVIALQIWLYIVGAAIVIAAEVEGVRLGLRRVVARHA